MIVPFDNFRATEGASPSRLGDLDHSPLYYKKRKEASEEEKSVYMSFGSMVDCLLTTPGQFDNEYYVSSGALPSDSIKAVIDGVYSELEGNFNEVFTGLEEFSEKIVEHSKYLNYGQSWKEATLIKKILDNGSDYFSELISSAGKEIISPEDYDQAMSCAEALQTNDFTKEYFRNDFVVSADAPTEVLFQVPLVWTIGGYICKGLIDVLFVDHNDKSITIVDLKTTAKSVYAFEHSYIKYRYYLQGGLYYSGVKDLVTLSDPFPNYTVKNPLFVVIEQRGGNPPFIFEMSDEDLRVSQWGGRIGSSNRIIKGYLDLLNDLHWHQTSDIWDYPRYVHGCKGVIQLNAFNSEGIQISVEMDEK